jgi:hypothetical protein
MLPHNFVELIDASIKVLKGIKPKIYPDFPTGGMADFANYNDGLRGGKVKVRARIRQEDKKTLVIYELPFWEICYSLARPHHYRQHPFLGCCGLRHQIVDASCRLGISPPLVRIRRLVLVVLRPGRGSQHVPRPGIHHGGC